MRNCRCGAIRVESELGKGTTFKIFLPQVPEEEEEIPLESAPIENLVGAETVLVVEDEVLLRDLCECILTRHGYTVLTASQGRDALEVAAAHTATIDLVLTDVVMPCMSGMELGEKLLERFPHIKMLYMSGHSSGLAMRMVVLERNLPFLQKPFHREQLLTKIREVLQQANPT